MGRLRNTIVATAIGAAIAAQGATAQTTPDPQTTTSAAPPAPGTTSGQGGSQSGLAPVSQKPAPKPAPKPDQPKADGGQTKNPKQDPNGGDSDREKSEVGTNDQGGVQTGPDALLPATASCGATAVPAFLIPIYQRAAKEYGLGPAGPSILAAINEIETGFGANQGPSIAGAVGWMQFMPSTWAIYGVDANGDGRKDPSDPEDAIFAAARYLRAGGMPENPEAAVFSYNHADWYVADVLARAACFSGLGNGTLSSLSLLPKHDALTCNPGVDVKIPEEYLNAFEDAAGRYDLGEDGVWALAAVARLESNFGKGMTKAELVQRGPMGISDDNWNRFAVDGDGDGKPVRESPADSAATLARMIWAGGSIEAGLFTHNHAAWYVDEVQLQATEIAGKCRSQVSAYSISLPGPTSAPINWANVELSNSLEMWDLQTGAIDPRVVGLIAAISQQHTLRISALRSDHSMNTTSGNVSNHFYGRAVDIAAIDGTPCTVTDPDGPCGVIARTLAVLPPGQRPTELIYCFDPDGPGPAFAAADHCDHVHAGFDA
jgi:membrane-bound lytic murein transglycosylase B